MASHRDSAPAGCEPIKRTGLVTHDHEKGAYAVEASNRPERAGADRLARMDLGAGHIGHIPSHIYYRVGRYKDSLAVNKEGRAADEAYLAVRGRSDRGAFARHGLVGARHRGREPDQRRFARSYAPGSPARQPICQNSISRQVASLKMAQSSASRAGVT